MSAEWIEAVSDELAMAEAEKAGVAAGASFELWDRQRLLARKPSRGR